MKILLAVAAIAAAMASPVTAARYERTVTVDGLQRGYIAHVPSQEALPVIIALHPALGTGAGFERDTGLHVGTADFITVYPDGIEKKWNADTGCCGTARPDDIAFLRAVLADIPGNPDGRVFVTGFSNGAAMAYEAACKMGEVVAIAPHGSTRIIDADNPCEPPSPVAVLHMHGLEDDKSLFDGGKPDGWGTIYRPGVAETIDYFVRWSGDAWDSQTWDASLFPAASPEVRCSKAGPHRLCPIAGLGHLWPGHDAGFWGERNFGPERLDTDGTGAVLRFFRGF